MSDTDRIPKCENCGVSHPWIPAHKDMIRKVTFECNECGREQTWSTDTGGSR